MLRSPKVLEARPSRREARKKPIEGCMRFNRVHGRVLTASTALDAIEHIKDKNEIG